MLLGCPMGIGRRWWCRRVPVGLGGAGLGWTCCSTAQHPRVLLGWVLRGWDVLYGSRLLPQDTELLDLRETIDFLKKKNSEAQAVIQGALNGTEVTPKGKALRAQKVFGWEKERGTGRRVWVALVLGQMQFADSSCPHLSCFPCWPQSCVSNGRTPRTASPASTASPATPASAAARTPTPRRRRRRAGWVGWGAGGKDGAWQGLVGVSPTNWLLLATLALWCWSPLSPGDSAGEERAPTVGLCLDVLARTSPAPLEFSSPACLLPWSFPHVPLVPAQAPAVGGLAAPSPHQAAPSWTCD